MMKFSIVVARMLTLGVLMAFAGSAAAQQAYPNNNLERHRYYRDFTQEVQQEWNAQWEQAIPMKRGATLKEFASLCIYLASQDAAYLTGQTYLVNGGMMYL